MAGEMTNSIRTINNEKNHITNIAKLMSGREKEERKITH